MHVHAVMDEFGNIALPMIRQAAINDAEREISVSIIIQNMAQLKALFKRQLGSIVGNCDELLYLAETSVRHMNISVSCWGKPRIDTNTYGKSQGRSGSYSTNYQHLAVSS